MQSYNLTGAGEPLHLVGGRITGSVLRTLGLAPALGRNFLPEEELPYGQESAALLGHGLWQARFGGRADVLGTRVQLNGRAFRVVGVLPRETGLPDRVEIFTPLGFTADERASYGMPFLHVLGRLKPGFTAAQARSELGLVFERVAAAAGRPSPRGQGWAVRVTPLVDTLVGNVRPVLVSLLGAVGCLLLIACANVASLLLARATARSQELAVRAALGAGRGRLIRQLLVESLALSLLGGVLGLIVAQVGLAALLALAPDTLPRAHHIGLDARGLAVTFGIATLSAILFGLAPALQASRVSLGGALRQAGRGAGTSGTRRRMRRLLVSGQVAVALILLAGAGLLMRSFARLHDVDPGFDRRQAHVAETFLPRPQYSASDQYVAFARRTLGELAATPGVEAAAVANNLPFSKHHGTYGMLARVGLPGAGTGRLEELTLANESSVSADYFRAMGIPLLRGRPFDERDDAPGAASVVVSESVSRKFFPGADPVGKALAVYGPVPRTIVGVVADVRQTSLQAAPAMQVYRPFMQSPDNDLLFVVRTRPTAQPAAVMAAIRAAITRTDGNIPVFAAHPLEVVLAQSIARQRFAMTLFAVFSGVALALAAIGVYGVMAFSVAQRTGEIGIRMALGARASTVARLVLAEGGQVVALGLAAGLAGAWLLTGLVEKLLFGVSARDPLSFAVACILMALAALPACLVPARRASRVDPMVALRRT